MLWELGACSIWLVGWETRVALPKVRIRKNLADVFYRFRHLPMFKFLEKRKPQGAAANEPAQELLMKPIPSAPTDEKAQAAAVAVSEERGTKEA